MLDIQCPLIIMNSIDRLKLLAGLPIPMSDSTCFIYPSTLKNIAQLGVETYFKYINLCTITKSDIEKITKEKDLEPFDFIFINCAFKEEFKNEFVEALKFFTKENVLFLKEIESFSIGPFEESRLLTRDNFKEFQSIIYSQNFFDGPVKSNGENESARLIKQKLEKSRSKIAKIKNTYSEQIELADLISALAVKSSLNIFEIWNISYYTFNEQFKRMRLLEQYDTGLQSIMAGADPKKVKLEDWIKKIQ